MNKPVILLGAGGHAKVLAEILRVSGAEVLGYTVPDHGGVATVISDKVSFLGSDDIVFNYNPNSIRLVNAVGSIKSTAHRQKLFEFFKAKGYYFAKVIHPSVIMGEDVQIGEGVQLMAGVIVQTSSIICDNVIINTRAMLDHDCFIGKHVHIAPGTVLSGDVKVEEGVHIGTGAVVIQGLCIGANSLVGAGAVVVDNVLPNSTVLGVPAKAIK